MVRPSTWTIFFLSENIVERKIRTHLDLLMILVQMYSIFKLLIGVPDYSIVVSRMEENKSMEKMMGI